MRFEFRTNESSFGDEERVKVREALGLRFREPTEEERYWKSPHYERRTDDDPPATIELKSLEELVELADRCGTELIVERGKIRIYDAHE